MSEEFIKDLFWIPTLEIQIDKVEIWEKKYDNQVSMELQLSSSWVGRNTCGKTLAEWGGCWVIWRSKSGCVHNLVWKVWWLED